MPKEKHVIICCVPLTVRLLLRLGADVMAACLPPRHLQMPGEPARACQRTSKWLILVQGVVRKAMNRDCMQRSC